MKVISWNVGRSYKNIDNQLSILKEDPDIMCLQEVTQKSFNIFKKKLNKKFNYISFSLDLIPNKNLLIGPRRLGVLIVSKYKTKLRNKEKLETRPEKILNKD